MINNIYTYLFISSLFCGYALSLYIRVLFGYERRFLIKIITSRILLLFIIAFVILPVGFFFSEVEIKDLLQLLAFFSISIFAICLFCSFLKIYAFLLIVVIGLGLYFFSDYKLAPLTAVRNSEDIKISVLYKDSEKIELEVLTDDRGSSFYELPNQLIRPLVKVRQFPKEMFFLKSQYYLDFIGFENLKDETTNIPSYIDLVSQTYILNLPLVEKTVLKPLIITFDKDGRALLSN